MSRPRIVLSSHVSAEGMASAKLDFRHGGQRYRLSLPIYIPVDRWDQQRQVIRGRGEEVKRENLRIGKAISRAEEIVREYELRDWLLTPDRFAQEFFQPGSREDFLKYLQEQMQSQYNRRLFGDARLLIEKRALRKLSTWAEVIPFSTIDRRLIERFDAWHATQMKQGGYDGRAERGKVLEVVRKYLLEAKAEGIEFQDPFQGFRWPKAPAREVWLQQAEVQRLLRLYRDPQYLHGRMRELTIAEGWNSKQSITYLAPPSVERMRQRCRAFLMQCFTGARYSDARRITFQDHVLDEVIVFTPVKTKNSSGKEAIIPITPVIEELLRDGRENRPRTGLVLSIPSNQKYNHVLKQVAWMIETSTVLTSHVARHTFGALSVAGGVSVVSLMDMLGVTDLDTVMVYVHASLEQQRQELLTAQSWANRC